MTKVPMKRYLLDMPYELLFEIFRRLPKGKLFDISRFSSQFGDVPRDTRLWKDVYIRYEPSQESESEKYFDFEELYSGPFPVKVIDLSGACIKPPICFETDQVVKVKKLNLSSVGADEATSKAILAKYQCRELHFDNISLNFEGFIMGITPAPFLNQTALEVLSLRDIEVSQFDSKTDTVIPLYLNQWLAPNLSDNCKNLKSLDLSFTNLTGLDSAFVKSLPASLEKLYLISDTCPGNTFFELLAESIPNLKEIGLCHERVNCPALLKFKFLEALHIDTFVDSLVRDLYRCLIQFPTLKNVHVDCQQYYSIGIDIETLRTKLSPHGITIVKVTHDPAYPMDGNLWRVLKAT